MRRLLEIGRAEASGEAIRVKERVTLQRHEAPLADVQQVLVRVTPQPDKQIMADVFVSGGPVYRLVQGRTLVDYRSFLQDELALSGIENFRKVIGRLVEQVDPDSRDPATVDFLDRKPPEGFLSQEELEQYDRWLTDQGATPGVPEPAHKEQNPAEAEELAKAEEAEAAWKELAPKLQAAEAADTASSPVRPKAAAWVLIAIGFLVSGLGLVASLWLVSRGSQGARQLLAMLAVGVGLGLALMTMGLLVYRRVDQQGG